MSARQPQQGGRLVAIAGLGMYVPERVLLNADLVGMVDTSDEWIRSRTGIRERRIAAAHEATSDLAVAAALAALKDGGTAPAELGLIVVASITPDTPWPNVGCLVQSRIGAHKAFCFGLEAACTGFLYALETARQFVAGGMVDCAMVIAAETMSRQVDWTDRNTCVLFGDGAGAVVLKPARGSHGIRGSVFGGDGNLSNLLTLPAGGSRLPASHETVDQGLHYLHMEGREVYKHAVTNMVSAARDVLAQAGLTADDVDWLVPHQANERIIKAVGQRLGIAEEKVVMTVDRFANTSSATIPMALDVARGDGRIRSGDRVLMVAFGGGFTWGATLLEWGAS